MKTPIVLLIAFIALAAGVAGGFIGGHVVGKGAAAREISAAITERDLATAGRDTAMKAESATKIKCNDLARSLDKSIAANIAAEIKIRDLTEAIRTKDESTAASKPVLPKPKSLGKERTYDEFIDFAKNQYKLMLDEEGSKTEKAMSKLTDQNKILAQTHIQIVKQNNSVARDERIVNSLVGFGLSHVLYIEYINEFLENESEKEIMKNVWKKEFRHPDFLLKIVHYMSLPPVDKMQVSHAIKSKTKPQNQRPLNAALAIAGDDYFK